MDSEDDTIQPREPSAVAQEISRLKSATFKVAESRTRLPQPLFWSVFGQQIKQIRQLKAQSRVIESILSGGVTEGTARIEDE